jgi:fructosamine-3-kinase
VTLSADTLAAVTRDLGIDIDSVDSVGGGCISPAYRVECRDAGRIFLKTVPPVGPPEMLEQEAVSLERISDTRTVRVPRVLAVTAKWLALEWLEPARADDRGWRELGTALARLHRDAAANPESSQRPDRYGWDAGNFIGSLPQANDYMDEWPAFWRERRLVPQLRLARTQLGAGMMTRFERLLDELGDRLASAAEDGPSLLHGDLWGGNVHFTTGGGVVIDPSSYYGHREVDLAMAALFGGFPPSFFTAYSAEWPLQPGVESRRAIYQLYYLLVHVNLFGESYVAQTRRVLDAALGDVR